jgi:hypothetical protein
MDTIPTRVGFVATGFFDHDPVGLQAAHWAGILQTGGHECFYFAGRADRDPERSVIVPEASCFHPDIVSLQRELFEAGQRDSKTSGIIHAIRFHLKQNLYQFIKTFDINLLIIENACSLPLNLPLGLALSELVAETHVPAIFHHFGFPWQYDRFRDSAAGDYLRAAFPPALPSAHHVVLNNAAGQELARHANLNAVVIPPALDFEDAAASDPVSVGPLRLLLDLPADQHIVLQPTPALPQMRIDWAIEAAALIDPGCAFILTGRSPLENDRYRARLIRLAETHGIDLKFMQEQPESLPQEIAGNGTRPSLMTVHAAAGWVSYPVKAESVDSGFLEALATRRPLIMARHDYHRSDLAAIGVQVFTIDETLDEQTISSIRSTLAEADAIERMTQANLDLGQHFFGLNALRRELDALLQRILPAPSPGR